MAESVKQAAEAAVEGIKNLAVGDNPKPQGVSKKKEKKANAGPAQSEELQPQAKYIQDRLDLYDSLKAEYLKKLSEKEHEEITLSLCPMAPPGSARHGRLLQGRLLEA